MKEKLTVRQEGSCHAGLSLHRSYPAHAAGKRGRGSQQKLEAEREGEKCDPSPMKSVCMSGMHRGPTLELKPWAKLNGSELDDVKDCALESPHPLLAISGDHTSQTLSRSNALARFRFAVTSAPLDHAWVELDRGSSMFSRAFRQVALRSADVP